jgi:hypothetical protein
MELLRHGLDVSDHGHGCANGHANGRANVCGVSHFCANHVCANGAHVCANVSPICPNDYDAHDGANCCSCANCTIDLWDGLRPHSVAYHK